MCVDLRHQNDDYVKIKVCDQRNCTLELAGRKDCGSNQMVSNKYFDDGKKTEYAIERDYCKEIENCLYGHCDVGFQKCLKRH